MNAETSWVHDIARGQKDMGATSMQSFEGDLYSEKANTS